jgi:transposase
MAPHVVHAAVQSPKHAARHAAALCAAVTRPTMRVGPIRRVEQPDRPALQRGRERLMPARTALVTERRGLPSADGRIVPQGRPTCRPRVATQLAAEHAPRTPCRRELVRQRYEACGALAPRLEAYDVKRAPLGQAHPACPRWPTLPGLGPVRATARIAALGDAPPFTNGRQLAAWLGFVPREAATGASPGSSGAASVVPSIADHGGPWGPSDSPMG